MSAQYNVLMVCTGNICRSPTAHGFLMDAVEKAGLSKHVHVQSAGTYGGHVGKPPFRNSIKFAKRDGIDISSQRAQKVMTEHFYDYDLILAMTEGHKDQLLKLCPDDVPINKIQLYLDYSENYKGQDVPDPYYYGDRMFQMVIDLIKETTPLLLKHIEKKLSYT